MQAAQTHRLGGMLRGVAATAQQVSTVCYALKANPTFKVSLIAGALAAINIVVMTTLVLMWLDFCDRLKKI